MEIEAILEYWFGPTPDAPDTIMTRRPFWFTRAEDRDRVDAEIRTRFGALVEQARAGALDDWKETPRGRLALIILLDQFPRNLFRNSPLAFASDDRAIELVREGIVIGDYDEMLPVERLFFVTPFVHSERIADHHEGAKMFQRVIAEAPDAIKPGLEFVIGFMKTHLGVIERFGRFPHRNAVLGRTSTPEEVQFLSTVAQVGTGAKIVIKPISLFLDFVCPFSYLAFASVQQATKSFHLKNMTYRPFALRSDVPPDGHAVDVPADDPKRVARWNQINLFAEELGVKMSPLTYFSNTRWALEVLAADMPVDTRTAFVKRCFKAVFEEHRNISDREVVIALATEAGVNPDTLTAGFADGSLAGQVKSAAEMARANGIQDGEVPAFLIGDKVSRGIRSLSALKTALGEAAVQ